MSLDQLLVHLDELELAMLELLVALLHEIVALLVGRAGEFHLSHLMLDLLLL